MALLTCLLSALTGCAAPLAVAQTQGASISTAASITTITLERDCSGCATGTRLVLQRDGRATRIVTGKARQGTEDKASTGVVRTADFDRLARLALAHGFFELNDSYEEPQLQDGPWVTTLITRGGQDKQVFRRDEAGPAGLKSVENAIDALAARIQFVPSR